MSASTPDVTMSEPEADRWQPVEQPEPAPAEETAPKPEPASEESAQPAAELPGTPAGHLLLGAACVLALGGVGLYSAVGPVGLAVGAGGTVAAGAGYLSWRIRRKRSPRDRAAREPGQRFASGRGGRRLPGVDGPGRRTSSSARTPSARPPAGGATRRPAAGAPTGNGRQSSTDRGGRNTTPRDRSRKKDRKQGIADQARHYAGVPARGARAVHRAARALHGKAAPQLARLRAASRRVDEATGQLVSRARHRTRKAAHAAGRRALSLLRGAGGWVDRRTGRRLSSAWVVAAAAAGFRAARRAVLAARAERSRWDAEATAAVVAAWAWLTGPLRRRWAARRAAKAETATQPAAAETSSDQPPPPSSSPTSSPAPDPQGNPMTNALIAHAIEMPTVASAYESEDMMEVKVDLELLREIPLAVAAAIRIWTENLAADYPLHQDVVEQMMTLYEGFCTLANDADEVSNTFQNAHADDIRRRLEPRVGERKWNAR
ncbi:hypothetical protein ABT340_39775 [Streptosporangium sp. NPDC000239]|uniref:hypothetical protein n=1 Tax=Streptosporangium sp. NPDC000239 TaxID=3154248 RepID=UPI0033267EC8